MDTSYKYWDIYNKALDRYKSGKFEEAKEGFLKLTEYDSPSPSAHIMLMRTYRKIIGRLIEVGDYEKALSTLDNYFQNCPNQVTDTDRKKYNQVIDTLSKSDPKLKAKKLNISKRNTRPAYSFENLIADSIVHERTGDSIPAGQAPRGIYFQIDHYSDTCWYIKNHYKDSQLREGSASIQITTDYGNWMKAQNLNHLIYRFRRANASDWFVALSFSLNLYLYNNKFECIAVRDISENIANRYQIRCVDLTSDGEKIYYSIDDKVLKLERTLHVINTWHTPTARTRETASSPEVVHALSVLGLVGNPSNEEIKIAYRKQLFSVHPDTNPNDPEANEKTIDVVTAYELLTSSNFREENQRFDKEVQKGFISFRFPAFRDSVTAFRVSQNNNDLLVGCYSGKAYILCDISSNEIIYDCKSPIREIMAQGDMIYLITDNHVEILQSGILVNRVKMKDGFSRIIFGEQSFLEMTTRGIKIFTLNGTLLSTLEMRDNIADAFLVANQLRMVTARKIYTFSIQVPIDYNLLDKERL